MKKINDFQTLRNTIESEPYLLVYVTMPNCSVCHADYPKIEKIVEEFNVPAYHIDADEIPEAAGQLQLFTSPVSILYYKGKEFHRQARIIDFYDLTNRIKQVQLSN